MNMYMLVGQQDGIRFVSRSNRKVGLEKESSKDGHGRFLCDMGRETRRRTRDGNSSTINSEPYSTFEKATMQTRSKQYTSSGIYHVCLKDEQSTSGGNFGVVEYLPLSAREVVPTKMSPTGKEGGEVQVHSVAVFNLGLGFTPWKVHSKPVVTCPVGGYPILNGGWLLKHKRRRMRENKARRKKTTTEKTSGIVTCPMA